MFHSFALFDKEGITKCGGSSVTQTRMKSQVKTTINGYQFKSTDQNNLVENKRFCRSIHSRVYEGFHHQSPTRNVKIQTHISTTSTVRNGTWAYVGRRAVGGQLLRRLESFLYEGEIRVRRCIARRMSQRLPSLPIVMSVFVDHQCKRDQKQRENAGSL